MTANVLPDASTPFGERVLKRLAEEPVVWLTTVGDDGTPQPNPVWFLWDGASFVVYNRADAQRVRHVRTRPRVSLNFDGNGRGGDIVVVAGRAGIVEDPPPCHEVPPYVAKYGERMVGVSGSMEAFAAAYPVVLRIHPTKVRGF